MAYCGVIGFERVDGENEMVMMIEDVGRYVDGTLQDRDVHPKDVEFVRVPGSGRDIPGGWACNFDVLIHGKHSKVTVSITETKAPND
jgi:hypothetical protein